MLKDIAIREGIVGIPHERKYGESSRVYGFLKAVIFSPDCHVVSLIQTTTSNTSSLILFFPVALSNCHDRRCRKR